MIFFQIRDFFEIQEQFSNLWTFFQFSNSLTFFKWICFERSLIWAHRVERARKMASPRATLFLFCFRQHFFSLSIRRQTLCLVYGWTSRTAHLSPLPTLLSCFFPPLIKNWVALKQKNLFQFHASETYKAIQLKKTYTELILFRKTVTLPNTLDTPPLLMKRMQLKAVK